MIIYSVRIMVEEAIHVEWLRWMQTRHIPDVMATGLFSTHTLSRVSTPIDVEGFRVFRIDYQTPTMAEFDTYQREYAPALQAQHTERFTNRFRATREVLEVLEHG